MPEILCLIAARGGSKRLPGKNLRQLGDKPLIIHSIEQGKAAGLFTVVSSDNAAIMAAAKGADKLIKRPAELATDSASSLDVVKHALEDIGGNYDAIMLLQPTSPLRLAEDIKKAAEIFAKKLVSSLVSVAKVKNLVAGCGVKDGYQINGAIYIWDKQKFLAAPKIIYPDTKLLEMPALRSLDIDYPHDFALAEILMAGGEYKLGESMEVA